MELHPLLLDSKDKHQAVQKIECHFIPLLKFLMGWAQHQQTLKKKPPDLPIILADIFIIISFLRNTESFVSEQKTKPNKKKTTPNNLKLYSIVIWSELQFYSSPNLN